MQVIVLGMHRSGTSVLARILNLMGIYLGPEGMGTGANPENPKGFWERRDVRLLNDAVLHSIGCDWNRVVDLDLAMLPEEMEQAFDEVAGRILLEMDAHRPWFIKEPRLCLLFPLWRRHLEVPVVVHVHRDPVEVAASLHRRNAMPMEAGLELWEYYVRSAATAAQDLPAVTVTHAELMSDPETVALRLHEELLGLGVQGIRQPTPRELAIFVDRSLHRERAQRDSLKAYLDRKQARMYQVLQEGGAIPVWDGPTEGTWEALREYESGLPPVPPPDPRKVRSAGYDAFMLDQRLKATARSINRVEAGFAQKLEQAISRLEDKIRASSQLGIGTPEGLLHEAIAGRERAEQELKQRYVELATAARELDAARKEAAQAAGAVRRLDDLARQKADAEKMVDQLQRERDRVQEDQQALSSQMQDVERKLRWLRGERKKLAGALEQERERNAELQASLAELVASTSWRVTAPLRALSRRLRNR